MLNWFWAEWFWLLPGYTWEDYKPVEGVNSPNSADLWTYPFLCMIGLILLRNYFLIPVFSTIGKYLGIRSKPYKAPESVGELEKLFKINRARPPRRLLQRCATEINWTERRVEMWLRQKALSQQMTNLEKFNDFGWQFTYYTCYFIFGFFFVVGNQSWCYNFEEVFDNYPRPIISQEFWWYYMLALGFYFTQTFLLCIQTRRHDFYLMLFHHMCTISLIIFSWVSNFVRVGAISLLIHESGDIILALGTLISYSGKKKIAEMFFLPFCLVWVITRLIIYPLHFLRGTLFVSYRVLDVIWPAYFLFNVLNVSLFVVDLAWTKEIVVAVKRKLAQGEIVDDRSSPEEMSEDEDDRKMTALEAKSSDFSKRSYQQQLTTVVKRPTQN